VFELKSFNITDTCEKDDCWQDGVSNKGREVVVLPLGKGNIAFLRDHGKAFVVTCSLGREK
jgi:hypothetical protein